MAQPLYFLPGLTREQLAPGEVPAPAILRERGLVPALGHIRNLRAEAYAAEVRQGPGKQSGLVVAYQLANGAIPSLTEYSPDQQEWREVLDGKLWIGYDRAQPPTPSDLQRPKVTPGYTADLAGAEWRVPVIRRHDETTNLPCDLYLERGNLVEVVKGTYRELWERMATPASWFLGGNFESYDKRAAFELCVDVLSVNYRFGIYEQSALRVIDTENLPTILALALDLPRTRALEEAQKKTPS